MWSRCIAAAAGAVGAAATRRRAYAANDDEGTPATTLVGAGALPNYSLRLSIVHFALILHAAAGPSGRVSPIDSSGSRSIRTGASIPVAPPGKQKTLDSFFANSARTVVARDKPVVSVVASQAMDVGNRWWDSDEDEEVQIDVAGASSLAGPPLALAASGHGPSNKRTVASTCPSCPLGWQE